MSETAMLCQSDYSHAERMLAHPEGWRRRTINEKAMVPKSTVADMDIKDQGDNLASN